MNEAEDTYGVRFSHEELVVLLQMFRAETLPGLEDNPLRGLSDEQEVEALASGERSLRARGLITVLEDEQKVEVDPFTLSLVGTCVFPSVSFAAITLDKKGVLNPRYYHGSEFLLVEHSFPEEGVHELTTAPVKETLYDRIIEFLAFRESAAAEGDYLDIPVVVMEELRSLVGDGKKAEAAEALGGKDSAEETIREIIGIYETARRNCLIVRTDYGEHGETIGADGLAFLESDNGIWAISGKENHEDVMLVEPVSSEDAVGRVKEILTREPPG